MIKKTIQINPDLFKINGSSRSKRKRKKIKPRLLSSSLKPNQIKKQLIARVKLHHKKKQMELDKEEKEKELKVFQDDFNESLNFLEQVAKQNIKKKKKKRENNTTQKKQSVANNKQHKPDIQSQYNITNQHQIKDVTSFIKSINKPPPAYGILKNSNNKSKPLFSQYNKTLKKSDIRPDIDPPQIHIENDDIDYLSNTFLERKNKLDELKDKIKQENNIKKQVGKKQRKRRQKTRRLIRKVTLGKNTKNGTIGVLIKNKKTRKHIKNEHKSLQKKALSGVKTYLRQHNLIKIGTNAPETILREIYESSHFAGNIFNRNPDVLLHNYIED